MLEELIDVGGFTVKAIIVVIAVGFIVALIASARKGSAEKGKLLLTNITKKLQHQKIELLTISGQKQKIKQLKQQANKNKKKKTKKKAAKSDHPPITYLINFYGDIRAQQVESLTKEITAILQIARPKKDEVIVKLESAGGLVHAYGLAAAQLARLREHNINLTVCVDKVAASGGYMMACIANTIVAAPFSVVGSIGVIAMLPNVHRLLQRWEIDVEMHTAGKYKRTLTSLGENTPEGRKKFKQDLERTHGLFKGLIEQYRPELKINRVATGEVWYGNEALDMKLIDKVQTSEELLLAQSQEREVYLVDYKERKKLAQKIQGGASALLGGTIEQTVSNVQQKDYERMIMNLK